MKDTRYTVEQRLLKVKTIYTGWWNYNKFCDMGQINLWSIQSCTENYVKRHSKMPRKTRIETMKSIFTYIPSKRTCVSSWKKVSLQQRCALLGSRRNCKRYSGPLSRTITKQQYKCLNCFHSDLMTLLNYIT